MLVGDNRAMRCLSESRRTPVVGNTEGADTDGVFISEGHRRPHRQRLQRRRNPCSPLPFRWCAADREGIRALHPVPYFGKGPCPVSGVLEPVDFLSALESFDLHLSGNHALESGMNRGERIGFVVFKREANALKSVANLYRCEPKLFRRSSV